ncbi:hypothetical protein FSP39_001234 [Pinctada imbricata]|uniref:Uncharacterized protein n=1 Tax=Pinctada imbricata TaxID=66713 RepID=A0AA88YIJ3_PINIB|nr:hypothetical protein FSP39_001234 [Pinctada imbricata]
MKMIQTTESVRNLYASHTASASLLDPSSNGTVSYAIAACFFAAIIAALVIIFRRKKRRQRKTRRIFNSKDDKSSTSSESLSEYSEEKTSKKVEVEMTLMSYKRAEEEQSIEEESRIYRSFPYQKESKHKTTKTGVHGSNPTYEMSLPVNTNNKADANEVFTGKVGGNEETVSQYFILQRREDASPMNGASTVYMEPITLSKQMVGKDDIRTHSSQMMFDDASKSKNVYSLARSDPGSNTASLLEYSENTSNVNSYESIDTDFTDSRVSTIVQNGEQFMDSTNVYNTIEETQCNFLKHHIT